MCQQPKGTQWFAVCLGYITGAGDMMGLNGLDGDAKPALCGQTTPAAMIQAFKTWAANNPKDWATPRIYGVTKALSDNWPCR